MIIYSSWRSAFISPRGINYRFEKEVPLATPEAQERWLTRRMHNSWRPARVYKEVIYPGARVFPYTLVPLISLLYSLAPEQRFLFVSSFFMFPLSVMRFASYRDTNLPIYLLFGIVLYVAPQGSF